VKYKGVPLVVKPWYWNILPHLKWCGASAQYSKIILRKDIYDDVTSTNPSPLWVALLEHEVKHIERQKKMGKWKFQFFYQFSPRFRINEELIADKARFEYVKKHKIKYDLEERARMLSSWKYFWAISYTKVKKELEDIYKKA
jgi:hypothetical protein